MESNFSLKVLFKKILLINVQLSVNLTLKNTKEEKSSLESISKRYKLMVREAEVDDGFKTSHPQSCIEARDAFSETVAVLKDRIDELDKRTVELGDEINMLSAISFGIHKDLEILSYVVNESIYNVQLNQDLVEEEIERRRAQVRKKTR